MGERPVILVKTGIDQSCWWGAVSVLEFVENIFGKNVKVHTCDYCEEKFVANNIFENAHETHMNKINCL